MSKYELADEGELDDGDRLTVQLEGREISVFRVDDDYVAYTNWCPHQSGPVCEGMLSGLRTAQYDRSTGQVDFEWSREGEILSCPWHGWEFDIKTGESLAKRARLISIDVIVEDGKIVVDL